jgi:Zn-dependent metalloprotease
MPVLAATLQVSTVTPQQLETIRALAEKRIAVKVSEHGLEAGALTITGSSVDRTSIVHVRVRQSHRGIPVFGGEAILHYRANGELFGETDDLVSQLKVNTQPTLTAADAVARAATAARCADCADKALPAALWIIRREQKDHLAYRVQLPRAAGPGPARPVVFVDAHDGAVLLQYDDLQTTPQK